MTLINCLVFIETFLNNGNKTLIKNNASPVETPDFFFGGHIKWIFVYISNLSLPVEIKGITTEVVKEH